MDGQIPRPPRVLFRASSVFPFDFFPNEIILDETKASVISRQFFWVEQVRSIMYKDMIDIEAEMGPFFATLKIGERGFRGNQITISYLWRKDAIEARRIVEGMKVIDHKDEETTNMGHYELVEKSKKMGQSQRENAALD